MMPWPRAGAGQGAVMDWARIRAYVTGTVDQELLARNEHLAAENRIIKAQLKGRLKLSDAERGALGEIGHRLGRKVLADVATIARPDTILGWYRKLVARKFDGSKARRGPGRPRIKREVEQLIIRMASENRDWGYDRMAGALANLGYQISDQTVGNVLCRRVNVAGLTVHPNEAWIKQIARNVTMDDCGALRDCRYLLHDRDTKFTRSFRAVIGSGSVASQLCRRVLTRLHQLMLAARDTIEPVKMLQESGHHGHVPFAAPCRWYAPFVQLARNATDGHKARFSKIKDRSPECLSSQVRDPLHCKIIASSTMFRRARAGPAAGASSARRNGPRARPIRASS